MRIKSVYNSNICYSQKSNGDKLDKKSKFEIENINNPSDDNVNKSTCNKETDLHTELNSKFDVRNATFDEIKEIANQLYETGEISGLSYCILSSDCSKIPVSDPKIKAALIQKYGGKQDWIKLYEKQAQMCHAYGDMDSYNQNMTIIKTLKSIEQ